MTHKNEDYIAVNDSIKKISEPPLNLLFNPSLVVRKNVWDIDVSMLLELLLKIITTTSGKKDLRICGIAALSSSMIYRLKVETIFRLEKIAMQKKGIEDSQLQKPITELNPIQIPFRFESTYPITIEELLQVLENMISQIANPKWKRKKLDLEPVQIFDFDQYFLKFEQIIQGYEDMILEIVNADHITMFKTLVARMESLDVVRCFLAILYLAMKGKVNLEQFEDGEDIRITAVNSINNKSNI